MTDLTGIPVIISGIRGKMGRTLVEFFRNCPGVGTTFELVGGLERPDDPLIGKPLKEIFSQLDVSAKLHAHIREIDVKPAVLIEFCSSPEAAVEHCKQAQQQGWKVVVGTTGFTQKQIEEIYDCTRTTAIVLSPNFSIGVNILFKLAEQLSRLLVTRYDVEIIDIHHREKRDAPSGTARRLAEIMGREVVVHSLRVGDVVGEHTIIFAGNGERLEVTHRASSRETFARGAFHAAEFVWEKESGLYNMAHVLGFLED